jgi:predicted MPP superfamily phosphohydrolase
MATVSADPQEDTPDRPSHHRARRRARIGRFLWILASITAAMHVPVALGVGELARRLHAPHPWLIGAAWGAFGAALFVSRMRAGMPDNPRHPAIVRLVDIPYFVHWCAALWTLIPALVVSLVLPVVELARGIPVEAPVAAYMWMYLSGLAISGYGVLIRRRWFRVVDREVKVAGLPAAFDGLRVAHLSDLHVGTLTPRSWGLRWARAANAASPDLTVVTGDLVTSGSAYTEAIADVLGELRAPLGVFSSMGNHDYFGDEEPLVAGLRGRGVHVLRNEGVVVEKDGARLWLAAIDDTWTRRDDLGRALAQRPQGLATLLLAHDPKRFDQAADAGVELVLSGHTHGGQVAMPFAARALNLARIGYRYSLGFYERGRSTLYVHPGLGTTGPPMRLGAAPEVTILVLRARAV